MWISLSVILQVTGFPPHPGFQELSKSLRSQNHWFTSVECDHHLFTLFLTTETFFFNHHFFKSITVEVFKNSLTDMLRTIKLQTNKD